MIGATTNGGALDIIYDSEVPRTFTGRAREVLSGGQFVVVSGAAGVVGSTIGLFIPGSIVVSLISGTAGAWYANGIALNNAGSNSLVTIATRGTYIANSAGVISGGQGIYLLSGTIQGVRGTPNNSDFSGTQVGRSVTAAASGTLSPLLVDFSF